MIDLCNDYGMDAIEMGNVLSMAMEASEKGYIKERSLLGRYGQDGGAGAQDRACARASATPWPKARRGAAAAFGHPEWP